MFIETFICFITNILIFFMVQIQRCKRRTYRIYNKLTGKKEVNYYKKYLENN